MTTTIPTVQHVTSDLIPKWVASYFRKLGLTVEVTRLTDEEGGGFVLSNSFLIVHTPNHPDLAPYHRFEPDWGYSAQFPAAKSPGVPREGRSVANLWSMLKGKETMGVLSMTHELCEVPGERKKPGTFFRKLADREGRIVAQLDKRACDLLSPDLGELEGFLFEVIDYGGCVRVSGRRGHVAYIMPRNPNAP